MESSHTAIVDYWAKRQDECGLSVDWLEADNLCWRCAHARLLQRCHIVPKSLGGSDEPSNLVLLCGQCHSEAPNIGDPEFMWTWLRAHATPCYGTYWQVRGFKEYELIYGQKFFANLKADKAVIAKLNKAMARHIRRTSTHWGQGKLNPATVAWLLWQVESEVRDDA